MWCHDASARFWLNRNYNFTQFTQQGDFVARNFVAKLLQRLAGKSPANSSTQNLMFFKKKNFLRRYPKPASIRFVASEQNQKIDRLWREETDERVVCCL